MQQKCCCATLQRLENISDFRKEGDESRIYAGKAQLRTHFACLCLWLSGGEQKALLADLSWSDPTQLCPNVVSVKSNRVDCVFAAHGHTPWDRFGRIETPLRGNRWPSHLSEESGLSPSFYTIFLRSGANVTSLDSRCNVTVHVSVWVCVVVKQSRVGWAFLILKREQNYQSMSLQIGGLVPLFHLDRFERTH